MFAIVAAVLFVLGVIVPDTVDKQSPWFWLLLGLAALAVHFAGVLTNVVGLNRRNNGS